MKSLVLLEHSEGKIKKSSWEAVAYAKAVGECVALAMGPLDVAVLGEVGSWGASKVLYVPDERLNQGLAKAYAHVLLAAMKAEGADTLVLASSSLGTPVAALVAASLDASLVTNVVSLPEGSGDQLTVKKSIYTGKAFASVRLPKKNRVFVLRKNAAEARAAGASVTPELFPVELPDSIFNARILKTEKATGDVLLPEAEIVVSGGRGLKGPEHWGILEELAKVLQAATGCSKPVSDMGWRPHHEHVGQTGVKVAPQLYIAIGISGAIQHLAGVNSSKCIVVINKDADAPFFKAADYGIVGDAFEVLPRLTEAIRKAG